MVALRQPQPPRRRPPRPLSAPRVRALPDAPLPVVRIDALPEHVDYADTGCAVAPSCLRCPLARCIEDEPAALSRARRDREIAMIHDRYGASPELLARTYGITGRQVFRILRRAREAADRAVSPAARTSAPPTPAPRPPPRRSSRTAG